MQLLYEHWKEGGLGILLFMLPFVVLPAILGAKPTLWQKTEIRGDAVRSLAITASENGQIGYMAVAERGVFVHRNEGPWRPANRGMPVSSWGRLDVQLVRAAPWDNRVAYAALRSERGTVYRTTDAGNTWAPILVDLGSPIRDIALSPLGGQELYVATSTRLYSSADAGNHWRPTVVPPGDREIRLLALSSSVANRLYLARAGGQLLRTNDGGSHWISLDAGLEGWTIQALALDPTNEQRAYVGTRIGVFGTRDGGLSWQYLNRGTWAPSIRTLLVDPLAPKTIYAGTERHGIYWSTDSGLQWKALARGMGFLTVYTLALDPLTHRRLYAGTSTGLWKLDISTALRGHEIFEAR